jgi:hypothetical protein
MPTPGTRTQKLRTKSPSRPNRPVPACVLTCDFVPGGRPSRQPEFVDHAGVCLLDQHLMAASHPWRPRARAPRWGRRSVVHRVVVEGLQSVM